MLKKLKKQKLKFILLTIFLVIQCGFSSKLFTQTSTTSPQAPTNNSDTTSTEVLLDKVVIEAKRPQIYSTAPVIATIERAEIQGAPISSVQELLDYLQGVDIRTRGVEGMQADVSIRGGTFDQTVVLLNGVNLTDPQTGHHSLNIPIDISAVERIEVLQGIDTWIAGVPTFCGAINIVTLSSTNNVISPYLSYGMNDFVKAGVTVTINPINNLTGMANVSYTKSGGYVENTDFGAMNAFLLLNYDAEKAGNFELQTGYVTKDFGANNFYSTIYRQQFELIDAFVASIKYNNGFNGFENDDKVEINATAYYRKHNDEFQLFRWDYPEWYTGANFHSTDIFGVTTALDYKWDFGTTSLGIDWRSEYIKSSNLGELLNEPIPVPGQNGMFFNKSKLRVYENAYLKHYVSVGKWNFQLGTMASGNNNFDFEMISGGNVKYNLNNSSSLLFSVQQGYRLPTFTDLFYDGPQQKGRADLEPEESVNTELAYQFNASKFNLCSKIFYRYGYRIIDWVYNSGDATWYAENLTNVATMGFDISAEYRFDFIMNKIKLEYSYLDVYKETDDNNMSLYATDFLRHQLNLGLNFNIWETKEANLRNNVSATWKFRFQSRAGAYTDMEGELVDYPAFLLCDLKLAWQIRQFNLYIDATNLFDTNYLDIGNLPQPGIWVKAGVAINIGI